MLSVVAYKSNYNKPKNQVVLLMINDEANNCYYFAVKNLSELNSSGQLRSKKEAIINGDNNFQNALNDALSNQTIEKHPERMSKLKPYINSIIGKGQIFQRDQKNGKKLNKIIRQLHLIYYLYHTIQKQ